REGLEAGLKDANGQATVSELIVKDFAYETCLPAARRFLSDPENRPDGVFAVSDIAAIAFAAALREVGLAAGKDVPIVGYNDIPSAACFSPAITTVRQDTLQAGTLLVEKLMQILEGLAPKSVMLPTNLVVRET
ncbi:MAG: substrate-binding domain-containing protein, partial [Gemmatimonadetes bacterium]|nr:substrate-binding domain-containing protein [Gemmatimonadota bacterium]